MLFAKAYEQILKEVADDLPQSATASSVPFPPAPKFVKIRKNGKTKIVLKPAGPQEIRTFPKMN